MPKLSVLYTFWFYTKLWTSYVLNLCVSKGKSKHLGPLTQSLVMMVLSSILFYAQHDLKSLVKFS